MLEELQAAYALLLIGDQEERAKQYMVRQKRKRHWPLTLPPTDSHRFAPFSRLGQASELAGVFDTLFPEEKNGRMTGNL